jgi:hypothetical protein
MHICQLKNEMMQRTSKLSSFVAYDLSGFMRLKEAAHKTDGSVQEVRSIKFVEAYGYWKKVFYPGRCSQAVRSKHQNIQAVH